MEFESLVLEVAASKVGFKASKPPIIRGASGVDHKFSFVVSDKDTTIAFDYYDEVNETDIIKSYIKLYDTGAKMSIVSLTGRSTSKAQALAHEYNMPITTLEGAKRYFEQRVVQTN